MSGDYGSRTRLQWAWLVGAAGLLVVLVVGGGLLVWRGLDAPRVQQPAGQTAPSTLEEGEPAFGAPQVVDGVPWGFAPTTQGAMAAAVTAVAVTGQDEVVFDADRFAEVATVVFAPGEEAEQARKVAAARTEFEVSGWGQQPTSRRMYHFVPLAVRLLAFDDEPPAAQVEVWAMTLVGVGDAGGAVFTTSSVELAGAPDGDGWQVTSLDSAEGPTPLVIETPSAPGRTRGLLRDAAPTLPLPLPPLDETDAP